MCSIIDQYDTQLTLNGLHYRVSFIPELQRIIYTSSDLTDCGTFDTFMHIPQDEPDESTLIDEIIYHKSTSN